MLLLCSDGWNQWNQWGAHWGQAAVGVAPGNWEWSSQLSGIPDGKSPTIPSIPPNVIIPPPAPIISGNAAFTNHCNLPAAPPSAPPSVPPTYGYNTMGHPQPQFNNQVSNQICLIC